jgi:hypothetical protein
MSSKSDNTTLGRRVLASIPAERILDVVDQLDLRPSPGSAPVFLVPLRSLKQKRDVESFVRSAPPATVSLLLEVIGQDALATIIERLGDSSADPTYEELSTVMNALLSEGGDPVELRAVCGHVVMSSFPAAPHCQQLLSDNPALALP